MNDKELFESKFFDVKHNKPRKGQIMAKFMAKAELLDGPEKRNLISLLKNPNKAIPVSTLVKNALRSTNLDSFTLPIAMAKDLIRGLSDDRIAKKPYYYTLELFYFADRSDVPDSPHWQVIELVNLTEKTEKIGNYEFTTKIQEN